MNCSCYRILDENSEQNAKRINFLIDDANKFQKAQCVHRQHIHTQQKSFNSCSNHAFNLSIVLGASININEVVCLLSSIINQIVMIFINRIYKEQFNKVKVTEHLLDFNHLSINPNLIKKSYNSVLLAQNKQENAKGLPI